LKQHSPEGQGAMQNPEQQDVPLAQVATQLDVVPTTLQHSVGEHSGLHAGACDQTKATNRQNTKNKTFIDEFMRDLDIFSF